MVDEFKIVMHVKGQTATIGISKPECDPVFFQTDSTLTVLLGSIPRFLEDAEKKWQTGPRYPKAELTTPPPPAPAATTVNNTAAAKPKVQTPMF